MKILIRGTNWIGDGVMTVPAMRELRRIFPRASISLHVRSWAIGVFQDADFIDELIPFETAESSLNDVVSQSRLIRGKGFDLAVIFPNSFASALTARFAGIPRRFGYSRDARKLFLTDPVKMPAWKNERHEVFYYLNLVSEIERSMLGADSVSQQTPDDAINVSDGRKILARQLLSECGVDLSKPVIALGVGSTNSRAKRWGAEKYAALNDRLRRELVADVILVGGGDDKAIAEEVLKLSEFKPIDLTGNTDLSQVTAVLSVVNLLISNDMGLSHIAPAVGTQTIVVFGPTNPQTTRPFSANGTVIRKQVECSPCMLRDCPIDHRCMTRITADEVFDLAAEKLRGVATL